ncbi:MAG TPA: thiamine-phosphate kinase [bacterium]|jgi:thiamine-monophosphate kinase
MNEAMTVAGLGEEGIIALIARACPTAGPGMVIGIGDDAAVLNATAGRTVVTTDLLVEGTHFDWRYSSPADVGHKALAVNLSDVAAMGAVPGLFFLSLGLPPGTAVADVEGFAQSMGALARASGIWLAGGDTVAAPAGWVVSITLHGQCRAEPVRRAGARPGDLLCVSGTLGEAAAGLRWLAGGRPVAGPASAWVARHRRPEPRLALGQWLAEHGLVSAMLDLSDGLATDAPRLAAASGCGLDIDLDTLPIDPTLIDSFGVAAARRLALAGGEDFELLFTVPLDRYGALVGVPVTEIGRVTAAGTRWLDAGHEQPPPRAIDHHFPLS